MHDERRYHLPRQARDTRVRKTDVAKRMILFSREQGTLTREDIELAVRKQDREAEEEATDRAGRRTTDGGGDEDEGPHGEP